MESVAYSVCGSIGLDSGSPSRSTTSQRRSRRSSRSTEIECWIQAVPGLKTATRSVEGVYGYDGTVWYTGFHTQLYGTSPGALSYEGKNPEGPFIGQLAPGGTPTETTLPEGDTAGPPVAAPGGDVWYPESHEDAAGEAAFEVVGFSAANQTQSYPVGSGVTRIGAMTTMGGDQRRDLVRRILPSCRTSRDEAGRGLIARPDRSVRSGHPAGAPGRGQAGGGRGALRRQRLGRHAERRLPQAHAARALPGERIAAAAARAGREVLRDGDRARRPPLVLKPLLAHQLQRRGVDRGRQEEESPYLRGQDARLQIEINSFEPGPGGKLWFMAPGVRLGGEHTIGGRTSRHGDRPTTHRVDHRTPDRSPAE